MYQDVSFIRPSLNISITNILCNMAFICWQDQTGLTDASYIKQLMQQTAWASDVLSVTEPSGRLVPGNPER